MFFIKQNQCSALEDKSQDELKSIDLYLNAIHTNQIENSVTIFSLPKWINLKIFGLSTFHYYYCTDILGGISMYNTNMQQSVILWSYRIRQ